MCGEWALIEEFRDLDVKIKSFSDGSMLAGKLVFEPVLIQ